MHFQIKIYLYLSWIRTRLKLEPLRTQKYIFSTKWSVTEQSAQYQNRKSTLLLVTFTGLKKFFISGLNSFLRLKKSFCWSLLLKSLHTDVSHSLIFTLIFKNLTVKCDELTCSRREVMSQLMRSHVRAPTQHRRGGAGHEGGTGRVAVWCGHIAEEGVGSSCVLLSWSSCWNNRMTVTTYLQKLYYNSWLLIIVSPTIRISVCFCQTRLTTWNPGWLKSTLIKLCSTT